MKKKVIIKLIAFAIIALPFLMASNSIARDEAERQTAITSESTFEERTFDTKEVQGEELLGVPDPPDENGDPIDTPAGTSLLSILTLLALGSLIIIKKNKE